MQQRKLQFQIPEELYELLRTEAYEKRKTMAQIIRELLEEQFRGEKADDTTKAV